MMQGYNDRLDESLGNRNGVEPMMMQSFKDRRDESKGMEKSMGRRAYQSVGTMDKMAKGGVVSKMSYDEFIETLQPYEIEGGFGETIRKGMKMYYLKPTHPMYNYNFDYQNKTKAYKEYVDYISQEGNKKYRE